MVCTYTGNYTYQPDTMDKSTMDIVCDAIIDYVETYGENHGIRITISNAEGWEKHGKPINVKQYNIASGNDIIPIEEAAEMLIAYYESYMEDDASNFGENPYYIGEPWSEEDIEVFVRENMIEYWA